MSVRLHIQQIIRWIAPEIVRSKSMAQIFRCERRLAYSAVPLLDGLQDLIEAHGEIDANHSSQTPTNFCEPVAASLLAPSTAYTDIYSQQMPFQHVVDEVYAQSTAAHNLTGLTQARQTFGLTGAGQTIAVIDSGIAYDHVNLGGGYGPGYRVVGGYDFAENDANPYDDAPAGYHGTAVAGVIGSDSSQYPGVASGVDLVALRVFNDMGSGSLQSVENALRWIHDNRNSFEHPITTVNLSLGTTWNSTLVPNWATLEDELLALQNDGILVVASAGNSFKTYQTPGLSYPAASPYVLPVASVDNNGQLSDFSQRSDSVIAAPGRAVTTTVPDSLLGADGRHDDYSTVSGTSFSSPYVAGATALIREAFQIVGVNTASLDAIKNVLFDTADSVYDAATNAYYDRLNISRALDSIIPDDVVGNTAIDAQALSNSQTSGRVDGFVNYLGDQDVYQWQATQSGTLELDFESSRLSNSQWLVLNNEVATSTSASGNLTFEVQAGQTYSFGVTNAAQIGAFSVNWAFTRNGEGEGGSVSPADAVNLGLAMTSSLPVNGSDLHAVTTINEGTLTFQLDQVSSNATLRVFNSSGQEIQADSTVSNGQLRIDMDVLAGQTYLVQTNVGSSVATLSYANAIDVDGSSLSVQGSIATDQWEISLSNGITVDLGTIEYSWPQGTITNVDVYQSGGADSLFVHGSQSTEVVYMWASHGSLSSSGIALEWTGTERVEYSGGGGFDRVYAYDTDGDDELTIRPNEFRLNGAGYEFIVSNADRLYVDASRGGNDRAYMYDSAGDDRLSIRPQFSSMSSSGYFNYVTGFERVYAYATSGGNDTALIYDSVGNDTFSTNGDIASIVGSGYYSYTRYFETVEAISSAGGNDTAAIYSPSNATNFVGSDFVTFRQNNWSRTARGFDATTTNLVAASTSSPIPLSTSVEVTAYETLVAQNANVEDKAVEQQYLSSSVPPLAASSAGYSGSTDSVDSGLGRGTLKLGPDNYRQAWVNETDENWSNLQQVDLLTIALMDEDREQLSLEQFFGELGADET